MRLLTLVCGVKCTETKAFKHTLKMNSVGKGSYYNLQEESEYGRRTSSNGQDVL